MVPLAAGLLHVYLSANARRDGEALYGVVVEKARALGMAGATVFDVEFGFGAHHRLHDAASEYSSYDLPVVIEIIGGADRADELAGELRAILTEGLLVANAALIDGASADAEDRLEGAVIMNTGNRAKRLSIYLAEADAWDGRNLALAIVERCRESGIAGATVYRGLLGYGARAELHQAQRPGWSESPPEKIEIIDSAEKIAELLPRIEAMIGDRLAVLEDVQAVHFS